MCVLALAFRAHPRWQLVIAGNRDELHARPAAPLARWDDHPEVIAGRDLAAGGTWLGVSAGRVAVVTNLRGHGPPDPARASRGALVADLLTGTGAYADPDATDLMRFNPFNLVLVDAQRARFVSNRPAPLRTTLEPAVYGVSNGPLDAPWPKTLHLKSQLTRWLTAGAEDPRALFAALRDELLPSAGLPPTDVSDVPQEARASPVFISNPVYGTRCSTIIAVDANGTGIIAERRFDASGATVGEDVHGFTWPVAR